ncbi:MAG: 6-phosphofructokinase [Firmicutes bacterium]|nr:6-phosphofructokinase [Bacillota bacterium]
MAKLQTLGVLTGGGDCPGLNAVLRALVRSAIYDYGLDVVGFRDGFAGLIHGWAQPLTMDSVAGLLPRGGTFLGTTNRDNPFRYPVRSSSGTLEYHDMSGQVLGSLEQHRVDCLVVVGGDGSLHIAHELSQLGVPVVGVPKTIDNDLSATDQTFGFDTAVSIATEALDRLHTTAESHHRVMILEVMGRYAGWIALHSGLAGGADVILIPEIPFTLAGVVAAVERRRRQGKRFSIVVVAEGATPEGHERVVRKMIPDSPEPVRLGGIGSLVADEVERATGIETRVTVLGHIQRGGTPTAFDRVLATRYGVAAVWAAQDGQFGSMVALHGTEIVTVPLETAISRLRTVDPDGELVRMARSIGIAFGDEERPTAKAEPAGREGNTFPAAAGQAAKPAPSGPEPTA